MCVATPTKISSSDGASTTCEAAVPGGDRRTTDVMMVDQDSVGGETIAAGSSSRRSSGRVDRQDTVQPAHYRRAARSTRRNRCNNSQQCHGQHGTSGGRIVSHQRSFVEHHYHDHLHDPVTPTAATGHVLPNVTPEAAAAAARGARGGVSVAFPEKLHEMLITLETQGQSDVISFQPHGRAFLVHRKAEFVETIMPKFFQQSKLTSFQRQLNLYGFVRLTAGPDRGAYYHELFLRGRPDLCRQMVRTRIKGNGMKAASSPQTEPNFYNMELCLGKLNVARIPKLATRKISIDLDNDSASPSMIVREVRDTATTKQPKGTKKIKQGPMPLAPMFPTSLADVDNNFPRLSWMSASSRVSPDVTTSWRDFKTTPTTVSPPESPAQRGVSVKITKEGTSAKDSGIWLPWQHRDENEVLYGESLSEENLPHSGDAVHFEGLQFRYLDHFDVEDDFLLSSERNGPGIISL